jgi:hypothetical protein
MPECAHRIDDSATVLAARWSLFAVAVLAVWMAVVWGLGLSIPTSFFFFFFSLSNPREPQ